MSAWSRIRLIWRAERAARVEEKQRITYEVARQSAREKAAANVITHNGYRVCESWDAVVNELCDLVETGQITPKIDGDAIAVSCTVKIGAFNVWLGTNGLNFLGHPHSCGLDEFIMPEPITRVRLLEALESALGEKNHDVCAKLLDETRRIAWHNNVVALPSVKEDAA